MFTPVPFCTTLAGAGKRWVILCLRALRFLLPTTGSPPFSTEGILMCGGKHTIRSRSNTVRIQENVIK
ncbi:hypothetical protein DPMN_074184 [Dreissena polymorpha]|uniref:Secreted protein n=1 Tax=Dreissena polymorpha TaxID=45954 RepID=A0A9D4BLC1_DREPO|nr:hypothetical protein DPMN_074184 [Dreissena polymorpha]